MNEGISSFWVSLYAKNGFGIRILIEQQQFDLRSFFL